MRRLNAAVMLALSSAALTPTSISAEKVDLATRHPGRLTVPDWAPRGDATRHPSTMRRQQRRGLKRRRGR